MSDPPIAGGTGRLAGRRILLIVAGGIAAYKSLELVRLIAREGGTTRAVLTEAGAAFVTPLSLQALTAQTVHTDMLSLTAESQMGHIELSRSADLVVVAPASADLLARMAAGLADDLATTLLLATDKAVLAAPAMNVRMWSHAATSANLATLAARGVHLVGPEEGPMACNEFGMGRLAEPPAILDAIAALIGTGATGTPAGIRTGRPLAGMRALVTAGPTHEPIDPVRYIANRSSGRQGYAIASSLARHGAAVTLVSGPVSIDPPACCALVRVETAREMLDACRDALPADIAVCAAAVADWHVDNRAGRKIKKPQDGAGPQIRLAANPDILREIANAGPDRPRLVVGFAAETDDLLENARAKRVRKGCDWIVANDVGEASGNMGGDTNEVHLVTGGGTETWPRLDKGEIADRLAVRIAAALGGPAP